MAFAYWHQRSFVLALHLLLVRADHVAQKGLTFMLAGRRFKLREPIVAAAVENDGRIEAWLIPSSSIIEIVSFTANGLRMVDVCWDGSILQMLESDIAERGDELSEPRTQSAGITVAGGALRQAPLAHKVMRAASF